MMKSNYLTKLQEQYPSITDKFIKYGGLHCSVEEAEGAAQSLAKEVVEGLEGAKCKGNSTGEVSFNLALNMSIELIKAKFQL